jgi:hypothetical protein
LRAGVRSKPGHGPGFVGVVTVSELGKRLCAILGLNQSTHWRGALIHGCVLLPSTVPVRIRTLSVASRVAVAKLRLDGTPTPRSWVARMTKAVGAFTIR